MYLIINTVTIIFNDPICQQTFWYDKYEIFNVLSWD